MLDHSGQGAYSFSEIWPLLVLRYFLITAGVLAWLWEAGATTNVAVGAMLLAVMIALELVVHGPVPLKGRSLWGAVQVALGLGVVGLSPGLHTAMILGAVMAGFAAVAPLVVAAACFVIATLFTGIVIDVPPPLRVGIVGMYILALALGHVFLLRFEEVRRHRETVAQLVQAQERISEFAQTSRDLAASKERQRLAEELHDALGHALVGTLLQAQIARRLLASDPDSAAERLESVEVSIRTTLERVRTALRTGARSGGRVPLHLALEALVADFRAAGGPHVELKLLPDADSVSDVAPHIAEVLYRTTQEALTNAVRHGKATRIDVEAEVVGPRLYLRISDDGVGADQYTPGMGLSGMVSRIQAVGGTLRFQTAVGEGFRVDVGVMRR